MTILSCISTVLVWAKKKGKKSIFFSSHKFSWENYLLYFGMRIGYRISGKVERFGRFICPGMLYVFVHRVEKSQQPCWVNTPRFMVSWVVHLLASCDFCAVQVEVFDVPCRYTCVRFPVGRTGPFVFLTPIDSVIRIEDIVFKKLPSQPHNQYSRSLY